MLDDDVLATLTALIRTGSFEQTARRLHVTPSDVLLLGLLRYRATASPAFVNR